MRELEEIRRELKLIKILMRVEKGSLKELNKIISPKNITATIVMYIEVTGKAPKRLKWVFNELYIGYRTQKAAALNNGVTEKYIQILNKRLLVWLAANAPAEPKIEYKKPI